VSAPRYVREGGKQRDGKEKEKRDGNEVGDGRIRSLQGMEERQSDEIGEIHATW